MKPASAAVWGTVQQPILFPPIYMIERFARCHHVVVMDGAQFDRDNTQFKLVGPNGPIMQSVQLVNASYRLAFHERQVLRPEVWTRKLRNSAQTLYGRQTHYRRLSTWFEGLLNAMSGENDLTRFCSLSVGGVCELLGMQAELHLGRALVPLRPEEPTEWLVAFCNALGITDYEQGEKSMRAYFRKGPFEAAGITTWAQAFALEYDSNAGRAGHAGLSILDLLFVHGVDDTRRLLQIDKGPGLAGTAFELTR